MNFQNQSKMDVGLINGDQHEPTNNELPYKLLTVEEVDVDFLPLIYEIIRSVERDTHDTSQKSNQSQDTSQKVIELHKKLEFARDQIRRLPGVEYSKEEQLEKLETLRKQLKLKRELLLKYRNMYTFDIPKSNYS
uniref:Mediator of RNA polymerase II transcription subunit 9 n=1 Tax=Clastoptera arizonana TaxID=38151 RepID=A0A1B6EEB5_9HEMI